MYSKFSLLKDRVWLDLCDALSDLNSLGPKSSLRPIDFESLLLNVYRFIVFWPLAVELKFSTGVFSDLFDVYGYPKS